MNMQTFTRRPVLTTNISTVLIGSAMIGTFVLVPQLAQLPKGGDVGLRALGHRGRPAARARRPRLAARRAARRPRGRAPRLEAAVPRRLRCSTATALLGLAFAHGSVALIIVWACVMFAGVGAAFAAIPNLIVTAVDEHETGEATGVEHDRCATSARPSARRSPAR